MKCNTDEYYHLALDFHRLLQTEVYQGNNYLTPEQNRHLKDYYPNFFRHPEWLGFYEYNWATRLANAIPLIRTSSVRRILDAGCGVGSESIFFGFLNPQARITGIDYYRHYTQLARQRQSYWENMTKKPLNITFQQGDIVEVVPPEPFDLIWMSEAISHIYPPERFIRRMYDCLKPGGWLVISDTNIFNPYMYGRILRMRGLKPAELGQSLDETTGKVMKVYEENIFSIFGIEHLLRQGKFRIISRTMHGFLPPAVFTYYPDKARRLEDLLGRLPVVRSLGGIYTVIARK